MSVYSASGSPPNPIVPRGWPSTTSNAAAFHRHRGRGGVGTVVVCSRRPLSSPRMMNDPRVSPCSPTPLPLLLATLSWPYRLSASTFGQRARPPPPLVHPPSLPTPFHHDIPSPLASPDPVIEQPRSGGFRSLPLSLFPPPSLPRLCQHARFISRLFFPPANRRDAICIPSCCCCRRPSRLPRATTGVEAGDSLHRGKLFVSGKEILVNSIEIANVDKNCPIIFSLSSARKERTSTAASRAACPANKRSLLLS